MVNCSIDGCESIIRGSRGLCNAHYKKLLSYGDPLFIKPRKPICSVGGCTSTHRSGHGYCNLHFKRFKKYGDPNITKPRIRGKCLVDGCDDLWHARGYCSKHYERWKKHGSPTTLLKRERGVCKVKGCEAEHKGRGLCSKHYYEYRVRQKPLYYIWSAIRARCFNQNDKRYEHYGARGIRLCQGWQKYENFEKDMLPRPPRLTVDRKNTQGHYSCGKCPDCVTNKWPMNCRWATYAQQSHNLGLSKRNKYGHTGIEFRAGKWRARIALNYKSINLGRFETKQEAIEAYEAAKKRYHND